MVPRSIASADRAVTYVELLSQTRGHSLVLGLTLFLYKHGPPSDALSPLETFIESEVKNDILILKMTVYQH